MGGRLKGGHDGAEMLSFLTLSLPKDED